MNTRRKDVRDLIRVDEKIQSAMGQGSRLTDDDKTVIDMWELTDCVCVGKTERSSARVPF